MMPLLDAPVGDADTEACFQGRMGLTDDDTWFGVPGWQGAHLVQDRSS